MDYTVHGLLQARLLEWVAFPFSRGSSQPRDQAQVSTLQADSLPAEPPGKAIVWITTNSRKFSKWWGYQAALAVSRGTCMWVKETAVRTKHGTMDWFNTGKEYNKAVYFHLLINLYEDTPSKCWAGWITNLNQDCQEKYQLQICRYHSNGIKWGRTKEPPDEGKRGEWKSWLKIQHSKTKIKASSPITLWQIDGENNGNSDRLYFLGLQNDCGWWFHLWN